MTLFDRIASGITYLIVVSVEGLVLVLGILVTVDGWHRGITNRWLAGVFLLFFYGFFNRMINRIKW